jgi:hypothetical protein
LWTRLIQVTELLTGRTDVTCRKIRRKKEIMKVGRMKMRYFEDVKNNMTNWKTRETIKMEENKLTLFSKKNEEMC